MVHFTSWLILQWRKRQGCGLLAKPEWQQPHVACPATDRAHSSGPCPNQCGSSSGSCMKQNPSLTTLWSVFSLIGFSFTNLGLVLNIGFVILSLGQLLNLGRIIACLWNMPWSFKVCWLQRTGWTTCIMGAVTNYSHTIMHMWGCDFLCVGPGIFMKS